MIKNTGITRKVDELGRIVLPRETRYLIDVKEKDRMAVFVDKRKGRIILQKIPASNE